MQKEQLSQQILDVFLDYEHETGKFYWKERVVTKAQDTSWNKAHAGNQAGSKNKSLGYRIITVQGVSLYEHTLVWFWEFGLWPKDRLDHINGVRDYNRIGNLRECTQMQNTHNKARRVGNSSQYKGVSWSKEKRKWVSYINLNKQRKTLGYFKEEVDAARCYDDIAKLEFGEFAKLNLEVDCA